MSTVEIDTARHEREVETHEAFCDHWQRLVDEARADVDAGRDHDAKCDQESIQELLATESKDFWRLVRQLRTAETPQHREFAARKLQEHCNQVVDDMVTRYADLKSAPF
ncbi:hypothetical protein P3W43_01305 [Salinicola salarius]|nr:hypothetical protein [Salinicola salarius]